MQKLTDRELTEFLSTSRIGRILCYKPCFDYTIFSEVGRVADKIVKELDELIIHRRTKSKKVRLIAQDSTNSRI